MTTTRLDVIVMFANVYRPNCGTAEGGYKEGRLRHAHLADKIGAATTAVENHMLCWNGKGGNANPERGEDVARRGFRGDWATQNGQHEDRSTPTYRRSLRYTHRHKHH